MASEASAGVAAEVRRAARRDAVLDAALDLFADRGYLASPIESLCQHAHVSTKSFYALFDSREACYLALMQRSTAALQDKMLSAYARLDHSDAQAATESLLSTFAHAIADDTRQAIVLFGQGSATTAQVEAMRRANRRWAADYVIRFWLVVDVDVTPAEGVVTGLVGGLFDIVADWVYDLASDNGRITLPRGETNAARPCPPAEIERLTVRLRNFYASVWSSTSSRRKETFSFRA